MSLYFKARKVLKIRKKSINLNKSLSKKHNFERKFKTHNETVNHTLSFGINLLYAIQTLPEMKYPKLWATKDFLKCLNTQLLISWKVLEFSSFSINPRWLWSPLCVLFNGTHV